MSHSAKWTLAMLSWRCHLTLTSVLESYRDLGLLDLASEKLLFFQEITGADRRIAADYGFRALGSDRNAGCGPGMLALAQAASCEFLLLIENDWLLIEDLRADDAVFRAGLGALERRQVDVVRLRHRRRPGRPFWAGQRVRGRELQHQEHLLWSVCWMADPSVVFAEQIERIAKEPDLFRARSAHADFSFNPCLYRTEFARGMLSGIDYGHEHPLRHEALIQAWWKQQDVMVGQGEGLFMHQELDSPYSSLRRRVPGMSWLRARSEGLDAFCERAEKSLTKWHPEVTP